MRMVLLILAHELRMKAHNEALNIENHKTMNDGCVLADIANALNKVLDS